MLYDKEMYTRPSVDDIFAGKSSKYALAIAVAKRAREITDEQEKQKEKEKIVDKPVLLAVEEFQQHKYAILEPKTNG